MSIGQPPFLSVISLELARPVLKGEHPKKSIKIPFPVVTNASVKPGETVFPDLPDSFFADFTDSGPNATVILCQEAATDGHTVPGRRSKVKLPGILIVVATTSGTAIEAAGLRRPPGTSAPSSRVTSSRRVPARSTPSPARTAPARAR